MSDYKNLSIQQLKDEMKAIKREIENREEAEDKALRDGPDKILILGGEISVDELRLNLGFGRYHLCNYKPRKLSIHYANGSGSCGAIYGALADELGAIHDAWNYRIYKERAAAK